MNGDPILRAMVHGKKLRLFYGGPKLGSIPIVRESFDELISAGYVAPAPGSGGSGQPVDYELTDEGRRMAGAA